MDGQRLEIKTRQAIIKGNAHEYFYVQVRFSPPSLPLVLWCMDVYRINRCRYAHKKVKFDLKYAKGK